MKEQELKKGKEIYDKLYSLKRLEKELAHENSAPCISTSRLVYEVGDSVKRHFYIDSSCGFFREDLLELVREYIRKLEKQFEEL